MTTKQKYHEMTLHEFQGLQIQTYWIDEFASVLQKVGHAADDSAQGIRLLLNFLQDLPPRKVLLHNGRKPRKGSVRKVQHGRA